MTDIVLSDQTVSGSLAVRNMDDLARLSTMLAKSNFFSDAKDAAQCGVKVLAGLELGIPAFAAMTGIHIIKGKPSLSANVMAAIVKRSGKYNYKIKAISRHTCQVEFFEKSASDWESIGISEMSMADVKAANLDKEWDKDSKAWKEKHTWKTYPQNMLFARAMSNGVRWFCPDIFLGAPVYTPEELGAQTNDQGELIEVQPQEVQAVSGDTHPNNKRVRLIRELTLTEKTTLIDHLTQEYKVKNPAGLEPEQVDEVILWMAVEWAASRGMNRNHARNSYCKHVPSLIQKDNSEEVAVGLWIGYVSQQVEEANKTELEQNEIDNILESPEAHGMDTHGDR